MTKQEMAIICLQAKANNDERYMQLVLMLSVRTGLVCPMVEAGIHQLAAGVNL